MCDVGLQCSNMLQEKNTRCLSTCVQHRTEYFVTPYLLVNERFHKWVSHTQYIHTATHRVFLIRLQSKPVQCYRHIIITNSSYFLSTSYFLFQSNRTKHIFFFTVRDLDPGKSKTIFFYPKPAQTGF